MSVSISHTYPDEVIITGPPALIAELVAGFEKDGVVVNCSCGGGGGPVGKPMPVANHQQMYEEVSVFGKKPKAAKSSERLNSGGGIPTSTVDYESLSAFGKKELVIN